MKVLLTTTYGKIVLQLDTVRAPATTENFVQYVRDGHYDGTIFHRVISNFMIQGGGFTPDMARTSDPHSASAQFFVNVADNHFLDQARSPDGWGYAVFGKVVEGMETVERIKGVPTGNKGFHQDVPREDVMIESAQVLEE